MEINQTKHKRQLEINDLIDDAVEKAVARRNQALESDDSLLTVSESDTKRVVGGLVPPYITSGIIAVEQ